MNIDSHQHFWHFNTNDYGWMGDNMNVIRKDFLPKDLMKEQEVSLFSGSVAVQARQSIEETTWLLKLADKYDIIKGVVGWLDLCSPAITDQLSEFASHPKLVGVRHVIHDEVDENFILREDFLSGIEKLKEYNLTYDILIFAKHLKNTIAFVKKFPEHTFVLDHIAKPQIKDKILQPWKKEIEELAMCDNVFCKVSGMVTENNWSDWKTADFTPYLDTIFTTFGTNRVMIGSDWPVCKVAGTYQQIMDIVVNYIDKFPEEEKYKILGLNAIKAYNLKVD